MKNGEKVCAMIPLRGGSKGIKNKNIKLIAGKPLYKWVADEALQSKFIDKVYVSTEDRDIMEIVKKCSPEIEILTRPKVLATDHASSDTVFQHFAMCVESDIAVMLQATSPLTTVKDIDNAIKILDNGFADYNSVLSGTILNRFLWDHPSNWNNSVKPHNYDYKDRPLRHNIKNPMYMENGAIYAIRTALLLKHGCRLHGDIGFSVMSPINAIEVDEEHDWNYIESVLEGRKQQ